MLKVFQGVLRMAHTNFYFLKHLLTCNDKNTQFSINFANCVFFFFSFLKRIFITWQIFCKNIFLNEKNHSFEIFFFFGCFLKQKK